MQDNPQHNRVVRIQASGNSNEALPSETVLIDVPFRSTISGC